MKSSLRALDAMEGGVQVMEHAGADKAAAKAASKVEPPALEERSKIGSMVAAGDFITMVEIVPPKGIDCSKEIDGAALLHRLGVDAINVPDSPRASARMSAQSLCVQIQQHVGIETILHYTCRDRNVLSHSERSVGRLVDRAEEHSLPDGRSAEAGELSERDGGVRCGRDWIGERRPQLELWTGHREQLNRRLYRVHDRGRGQPWRAGHDQEVRRFAFKVEAGAEFAITQPVFDLRVLEEFLRRIEEFRIPVIAGIWPLTSLRNAEFMKNDLRVSMPDAIMARMAAVTNPEAARAEGVKIAQEMLAEARPMVQGVQVSAPFGRYGVAADVLGLAEVEVA